MTTKIELKKLTELRAAFGDYCEILAIALTKFGGAKFENVFLTTNVICSTVEQKNVKLYLHLNEEQKVHFCTIDNVRYFASELSYGCYIWAENFSDCFYITTRF
jgi:hypothetical protein